MELKKDTQKLKWGGVLDMAFPDSKTRRGRVQEKGTVCGTLDCGSEHGLITGEFRIRKLTPKECFRLQGFPDEYFEKAQSINSDTQLYKQAGNSVTVNVIHAIAEKL